MDLTDLVARYVALWNEPDADRRRAAVPALWAAEGAQLLEPPEEIASVAAGLGMTPSLRATGHAALVDRVARAYEEFVAPGTYRFRARGVPARLDDVVTFRWEMVAADGEVAAVGLEFLVLGADGRIRLDYQFIEA